jgi:hypothetical protein
MLENFACVSAHEAVISDLRGFMTSYDPSEGRKTMRITALIAASAAALALAACQPADKTEEAPAAEATVEAPAADAAMAPAADATAPAADAAAPAADATAPAADAPAAPAQ